MANPIDNNMRLPGTGVTGTNGSKKTNTEATAKQDDAGRVAGSADSRVESERLRQVHEQIDNTPEVDMERVERIKQAIAEGRYPIDARQIAEKFGELEGLLND